MGLSISMSVSILQHANTIEWHAHDIIVSQKIA